MNNYPEVMIIGSNPHSYLNKLIDFVVCYFSIFKILRIIRMESTFITEKTSNSDFENVSLTELMNKYGSDKGSYHGYTNIYESILKKKRQKIEMVLEIGIGTNDPELLSSMGKLGKPGASLRAWRDYLPNAKIMGLDIDRNIQFSEQSIVTEFVNQLSPVTFSPITKRLLKPIDLVIIDGLHTPRADFNSLVELLPFISSDGDLFIEDVGNLAMKFFWPPVLSILRKKYNVNKYVRKEGNLIHLSGMK